MVQAGTITIRRDIMLALRLPIISESSPIIHTPKKAPQKNIEEVMLNFQVSLQDMNYRDGVCKRKRH